MQRLNIHQNRVELPQEGYWREALNSMDFIYGGTGPVNDGTLSTEPVAYNGYSQSILLELPKMAFVVLEKGSVQTDVEEILIPSVNALEPNYPNPFNPSTTIRFSLAGPGHASLRIYGVYFYRLVTDRFERTRCMVLLR